MQKQTYPPIPPAPFAKSLPSRRDPSVRLPQAIAHRGYKALHPENSITAFSAAVAAGAHALETDLHLSADGEVVLSHDPTLKRCFGVERPVADCTWEYLSTLRTLKAPHVPMAKLKDLLDWLVQDGEEMDATSTSQASTGGGKDRDNDSRRRRDGVWLLLDVKADDDPSELMRAVKAAFDSVPAPPASSPSPSSSSSFPPPSGPWHSRVVIGCWNQPCLEATLGLLPSFPAAHISFSPRNSSRFLRSPAYPGLSFNMLQQTLVGPFGAHFIRAVRDAPDAERRQIYAWTVNDVYWMEWAVERGLDGVVTDDPAKFLDVLKRYEGSTGNVSVEDDHVGDGVKRSVRVDGEKEGGGGQEDRDKKAEGRKTDVLDPAMTKKGAGPLAPRRRRIGWVEWSRLYVQVFVIHALVVLVAPWMKRARKNSTFEEEPVRLPPPTETGGDR